MDATANVASLWAIIRQREARILALETEVDTLRTLVNETNSTALQAEDILKARMRRNDHRAGLRAVSRALRLIVKGEMGFRLHAWLARLRAAASEKRKAL